MTARLTEITFDAADPARLARFWAEVFGWPEPQTDREFVWISATGDHTVLPMMVFGPVPEAKAGKNRVHIDVSPVGCDQATELERLLALGATHADVGQGDTPWIVLADPEGNEFCLLGRRLD
jgi:predicted enzyme related to lactoylglutathione lyase